LGWGACGGYCMFTFIIAQRLGLESNLILGLSILEGVCMTIALVLLVERYLFSTTGRSPVTAKAPAEQITMHVPQQPSQ
jgi:hypothetical protein